MCRAVAQASVAQDMTKEQELRASRSNEFRDSVEAVTMRDDELEEVSHMLQETAYKLNCTRESKV